MPAKITNQNGVIYLQLDEVHNTSYLVNGEFVQGPTICCKQENGIEKIVVTFPGSYGDVYVSNGFEGSPKRRSRSLPDGTLIEQITECQMHDELLERRQGEQDFSLWRRK